MSLQKLFDSPAGKAFLEQGKLMSAECRNCKWFSLCRGGCRRDRDDISLIDYHCRAYRSFLEYAWPGTTQVAAYVLRRNAQSGNGR